MQGTEDLAGGIQTVTVLIALQFEIVGKQMQWGMDCLIGFG